MNRNSFIIRGYWVSCYYQAYQRKNTSLPSGYRSIDFLNNDAAAAVLATHKESQFLSFLIKILDLTELPEELIKFLKMEQGAFGRNWVYDKKLSERPQISVKEYVQKNREAIVQLSQLKDIKMLDQILKEIVKRN